MIRFRKKKYEFTEIEKGMKFGYLVIKDLLWLQACDLTFYPNLFHLIRCHQSSKILTIIWREARYGKLEKFKIAWIRSHQWKFKLLAGKFSWGNKKNILGDVNQLFVFKSSLTTPCKVLPLDLHQNFPPIIWMWRWWNWIQAIYLNLFYFKKLALFITSPKIFQVYKVLVTF